MLYFPIKMIARFYMHSKIYKVYKLQSNRLFQPAAVICSIMNKVDHKAVKINLLFGFLSCSGHPTPRARSLR